MKTDLEAYFNAATGTGVLATADADGKVDAAIYSKPHFLEDGLVAFIMRDRLTRRNLGANPHAAYLFMEKGPGYTGRRLYLTRVREEENSPLLAALKRRQRTPEADAEKGPLFLSVFKVDREAPLIGAGDNNG